MATYTAQSGGGNWNASGTWDISGYPQSGDIAILNATSGNVTVNVLSACLDLDCTGYTGTLRLSNYLEVTGNFKLVSGMGYITDSSGPYSVYGPIFTTTLSAQAIDTGGKWLGGVTFNGSGSWVLQSDFTAGEYPRSTTFSSGTLGFGGHAMTWGGGITIGSGITLEIGTGSLNCGYYWLTIESGATVNISSGSITSIGNLTVSGTGVLNCTGSASFVANGSVSLGSGFSCGTSTLTMWTGPNLSSVNSLYNFVQGVSWYWDNSTVTQNSNITILNDLTIGPIDSYSATFNCNTYTLTIGGNFTNNETFDAGSGTVIFNDNTKTSTIRGSQTFNTLQCLTGGKNIRFYRGQTFTVSSFDFTGSSGSLINIDSDNGTNTFTLSDSSGTNQVEYCDIHNSVATGGATWNAFTSDGNVDGGGNTGWVFSGVTIYTYAGVVTITILPSAIKILVRVYSGGLTMTLTPSALKYLIRVYSGLANIILTPSALKSLMKSYSGQINLTILPSYSSVLLGTYSGQLNISILPSAILNLLRSYSGASNLTILPSYSSILERLYSGQLLLTLLPNSTYELISVTIRTYNGLVNITLTPSYASILQRAYSGTINLTLLPSYLISLQKDYSGALTLTLTPSALRSLFKLYSGNLNLTLLPNSIYELVGAIFLYNGQLNIYLTPNSVYESIGILNYLGDLDILLLPNSDYEGKKVVVRKYGHPAPRPYSNINIVRTLRETRPRY